MCHDDDRVALLPQRRICAYESTQGSSQAHNPGLQKLSRYRD